MSRICTTLILLIAAITNQALAQQRAIDFNQQVRPIFVQHCTECHGGVKQAADLSLVYEDSVANIVEAGRSEDSELLRRVVSEDEDERMPPPDHGTALSPKEVDVLRAWIDQGAKWGRHWAYEIPNRHPLPPVRDQTWCRQPLDFFVLARLDAQAIQPSPDEVPERWLRRVALDLTGLPPTIPFRSEFLRAVDSAGEAAYEAAVDKLLASAAFGERWASVWFDQVRYADSRGLGLDGRRTIWKYRDWVIDALNDDLPYDQFTIKQVAGDLLPEASLSDRIATAVHRLTQSNEEGGTDDEEFRIAAVLDRVNTTWQVWQATTFGCVQCHHHPYDPFTQEDYYRFVAFFNNTADSDLNDDWPLQRVPLQREDYDRASSLQALISSLRQQIWEAESTIISQQSRWQPVTQLTASGGTEMAVEQKGNHAQFFTIGTVPTGLEINLEIPLAESMKELTAIRLTALPLDPGKGLADSEWGFVLSQFDAKLTSAELRQPIALQFQQVIGDEPEPRYSPAGSLQASADGFAAFTRIHHPRHAVFVLKEAVSVAAGSQLNIKLIHKMASGGSHPLVIKRGYLDVSNDKGLAEVVNHPELQQRRKRLSELEKQLTAISKTTVPVMKERPPHLKRPTHVFTRGLFLTKDKQVDCGVPGSLLPEGVEIKDRLELARWFVDRRNPLTVRVAVNRLWARIFGSGLVTTEEDFGSTGEPPSHPKLLDDLAVRFREDYGWSTKRLLREIVLSRTYRQSSRIRDDVKDAALNRWLARGPRNPLDAEVVRDQALAISGLLSAKMHGPPVHPPLPEGVWRPFAAGDKWATPAQGKTDRYRRSIYTYVKRSIPFPAFAAFDMPTREFCAPRRMRSNTPIQSLTTLNDETFAECKDAFANRMLAHSPDTKKQIEFGFLAATCRMPKQSELKSLDNLFQNVASKSDQGTAIRSVAAVILNLDEVLAQ